MLTHLRVSSIKKWGHEKSVKSWEQEQNVGYPEFLTVFIFIILKTSLKETRNSFKKWPLNLWWISNETITEVGNITKVATFKSFLHNSYKNTQLLFLWQCFLIFFLRQTLTDDFWGLHKNMNCAFPLRFTLQELLHVRKQQYDTKTWQYLRNFIRKLLLLIWKRFTSCLNDVCHQTTHANWWKLAKKSFLGHCLHNQLQGRNTEEKEKAKAKSGYLEKNGGNQTNGVTKDSVSHY